jgi:hypothetical protein
MKCTYTLPWLNVIIIISAIFLFPILIGFRFHKKPFDDTQLRYLRSQQPRLIFIGNSILECRIDPDTLSTILKVDPIYSNPGGGTRSAQWYLEFKNYIVASRIKPDAVCIFFREHELTTPLDRTSGLYWDQIERRSHEHINRSNRAKILLVVNRLYSIQKYGYWANDIISRLALTPIMPDYLFVNINKIFVKIVPIIHFSPVKYNKIQTERNNRIARINETFHYSNLRLDNVNEYETKCTGNNYFQEIHNSFLPLIILLSQQNDIRLIFIKVNKRPQSMNGEPTGQSKPEAYTKYLETYLDSVGVKIVDFPMDSRILPSMFVDDYHIDRQYRSQCTHVFGDSIGYLLIK